MRGTITQIGNSLGIIIPKEILVSMNAQKGQSILMEPTPSGFSVKCYDEEIEEQINAAKEGMAQYRNALRKLAE